MAASASAPALLPLFSLCFLLLLSILPFSSPEQQQHHQVASSEIPSVGIHAANDLILKSGYRYLDVRTEEEFKRGHVDVDRSFNIPYMFDTPQGRVKNPKFVEQVLEVLSKDDHLIVGCQSGVRSAYATSDLVQADFTDVKNLEGGYLAWVKNGLRVTQEATSKTEL